MRGLGFRVLGLRAEGKGVKDSPGMLAAGS